jgi:hypothetical protein
MADGTRRRRFSPITAKRRWYARHRAERFAERFGGLGDSASALALDQTAVDDLPAPEPEPVTAQVVGALQLFSAEKWYSVVDAFQEQLAIA